MVKVEISQREIQALDILFNKAECSSVKVGLILGLFRTRIQEELNKEREKQLKEKYTSKKKN
jgi:hypothetical protein